MAYRLEVISKEWGGTLREGWRPAIAGTLNQIGRNMDDETASTYSSLRAAKGDLRVVLEQEPDAARIVHTNTGEILVEIHCGRYATETPMRLG